MTAMGRRAFVRSGCALALAPLVPLPLIARAATPASAPLDVLATVAPELRAAAKEMLSAPAPGPLDSGKLPALRAGGAAYAAPRLADVPVIEKRLTVGHGAPDVTIYIINADPAKRRPGILHTHGGGFIAGAAKWEVGYEQELARTLDCVVVTVEYSLAPEVTYKGSIEQNYAALRWMHDHADEIGLDRSRIAVMGESAGGGHAALLAITARDRGEVPLVLQVLIYPMLDDRTGSSHAMPPHLGRIGWDADANRFGWRSFLGREPGGSGVPSAAVPARLGDLRGLAPAFIGVGGIDLFVEEDIAYAGRLTDAGVPTELLVIPGAFHGFDRVVPAARSAQRFTAAKLDALRRAFQPPVAV